MDSFFIFMYFPGLSGCRGIFSSTSCQAARQKSGFSSIGPSGRARQGGDGLYILPRKCAADFRGDRLCLLEICHTANGQPGAGWRTNVEEQQAGIERKGTKRLPSCFRPLLHHRWHWSWCQCDEGKLASFLILRRMFYDAVSRWRVKQNRNLTAAWIE